MLLPSIFDKRGDNYVPRPDEPSPFGPDIQMAVDNPWIVWKRDLEGYDERVEGSPTILREMLKERLEKEHFTDAEAFEFDTPPLLTTNGRHLSLAWVMYYKARTGFNWERVHRFGLEKIQKEQRRIDEDVFNGNEQLRTQWMSGLKDEPGRHMRLTDSFTTRTVANPDVDSEFDVVIPVKEIDDGKGGIKRIPWGDPLITAKDGTSLVTLEVKTGSWDSQPAIGCTFHDMNILGIPDLEKVMPKIVRIIVRALVCQFNDTPKPQPHYEKEKLVSLIPKSEVPAKGEFTLGVHAPFVTEVLAKHFCDVNMPKQEVLKRLSVLERAAMGGRREYIAKLDLVRQLIAYGLVFRVREGKVEFMVYKRNKLNGEKQMVSVFSIGIGGHAEPIPDFVDHMAYDDNDPERNNVLHGSNLTHTNVMDLAGTADLSYHREGPEEVTIYKGEEDITAEVMKTGTPIGFVCDSSDVQGFVGNSHFGIVYAAEAPAEATFEMNERNLDEVAWLDHDTLVDLVFARAHAKGQEDLVFPCGDILNTAGVSLAGNKTDLDAPEYKQFLEGDFEPWSQYIIHNLYPLVERILGR